MKLKKVIFNIMLFVLCFAGTLGCVLYSSYAKMKNSENAPTTEKTQSAENNFLVSLINNVTTAESLGGDLKLTSQSGNTNITGKIEIANDEGINAKVVLDGEFENTNLDLTAYYLTDTLYVNYKNLNLSFNVDDVMTALSGLLDGTTSGNLSDLLNMETLQSALTDMKTTELSSGGQKINLSVPYIGDFQILTNPNDVPIFISATNVNLNNDNYNLSLSLNTKANPFTIDTSIYTTIDVNGYAEMVSSVVKVLTQGGANFKGTFTSQSLNSTIDLELTINDQLEALLTANVNNTNINIFYSDGYVYLDLFNNLLQVSVSDCWKLIKYYFDSDFELSLIDKNTIQLDTSIGAFEFGLDINNANIDGIYINSNGFNIDLTNTNKLRSINFSTLNAKKISFNDLTTTIDRCIDLLTAKEYSIEIDGSVNNISLRGNVYVGLNKTKSDLETFAFNGFINGKNIGLIYKENYYYFHYDGTKVKFSSECVSDLYAYFTEKTKINYIDFDDILEFLNQTTTKIQIKSCARLSLVSGTTELAVLLRDRVAEFTANNISVGENKISASADIYAGSSTFKAYITNLNANSYIDLSNTTNTVKAVANSAKLSKANYTGYLTLGISNYNAYTVQVDLKTTYSDGKLKLVATLSNLPTTLAVTDYNSTGYKNHKATVTLYGGQLTINRTIQKRFSGTTLTETSKTYKFNEINTSILKDLFGFSNFVMNKITKATTKTSNTSFNLSSLLQGISTTDNSFSLLTSSLKTFGVDNVNAKITYEKAYLKGLTLEASIKNAFNVYLKLDKV